jgi:hypothetical protein
VNVLSTAGEPGFAALSSTRRRRDPVPSGVTLTQPRNHRDPAMAFHLAGGEAGPVAKARTAARGRAARSQGDTVTLSALAPQHHGAHTVLNGLLDRSALYGVLAEIEALGLDLLKIQN